jgi:hypothetical protein
VHADIGGGYENPQADFTNVESLPVRLRQGLGMSGESIRLAQQEAARRGLEIEVRGTDVLEVERRHTRKELAIHALRLMHAQALAAGLPLRPLQASNPEHWMPEELAEALAHWQASGGRLGDA